MSHIIHAYPLADDGVRFIHQATGAVHEPDPDEESPSLVALADAITERLAKGEALIRLLQNDEVATASLANAAWAIADLIGEARELYGQQWELIRAQRRGEGD